MEILIADDGSDDRTRTLVADITALSPIPMRHIWHEDKGFRLAAIRNKAIAAASGDYIIQIDGDVIPQLHFIEDHIAFARPGYFTAGSRGMLSETPTWRLLSGQDVRLSPLTEGVGNRTNTIRLPFLAGLYRTMGPKRDVKGCNMAFWRDDLLRVNGYDEGFVGWGCEDSELAARLCNTGIRQQQMKFRGVIYHLDHGKAPRNHHEYEQNKQLYLESIARNATRCTLGVDQYLHQHTAPPVAAMSN